MRRGWEPVQCHRRRDQPDGPGLRRRGQPVRHQLWRRYHRKFNTAGVGTRFNVSGNLSGPAGLAFDGAGNLFVTNIDDSTIEEFNSAGVGTPFNVTGDVNKPLGLAFDAAGNLFVANAGDSTIEEFNTAGMGSRFNVTGDVSIPRVWPSPRAPPSRSLPPTPCSPSASCPSASPCAPASAAAPRVAAALAGFRRGMACHAPTSHGRTVP